MRAMGFLLGLGLSLPSVVLGAPASVDVSNVQLVADGARTELVLSLSAPTDHTIFTLSQPDRIVIDVDNARLDAKLPAGRDERRIDAGDFGFLLRRRRREQG